MRNIFKWIYKFFDDIVYKYKRRRLLKELRKHDPFVYWGKMLLGINANNHDASIALVDGSNILFAGHAERYSRLKNDPHLNEALIDDALQYGIPDKIVWY